MAQNTLNSSKNYKTDNIVFNKYDYVLIFNNFDFNYIKKRNITYLEKSKIKRKNSLYNICGTIIDIHENSEYSILIEKDYKDYKLYKNDICILQII